MKYEPYILKDGMIINTETGKKLRNMVAIGEHINWLDESNKYLGKRDKDGVEYVDEVNTYADYYDLEELCELCNCLWKAKFTKTFCDMKFEKHMKIKAEKERKSPVPYTWGGRFNFEHTTRKGFWIEDWQTGKVYYLHNKKHIEEIVGLLNYLTNENRFHWNNSEVGNVIEDSIGNDRYVLGDSKDIGFIRDILNYFDRERYGERDFPYRHLLM